MTERIKEEHIISAYDKKSISTGHDVPTKYSLS